MDWGGLEWIVDCSGSEWSIVSWTVKYSMSPLTQLSVPGEARSLKIAPEAIYTSSLTRGWGNTLFSRIIWYKDLTSKVIPLTGFNVSRITALVKYKCTLLLFKDRFAPPKRASRPPSYVLFEEHLGGGPRALRNIHFSILIKANVRNLYIMLTTCLQFNTIRTIGW